MERLFSLFNATHIVAVDDEDEALCASEVVLPQGAQHLLAADVPAVKLDVLVLQRLNIEANRWNRVDRLVQLHLEENGRLAGSVKAEYEHAYWSG